MRNSRWLWPIAGMVFVVAALLDLKYKGLGYRVLPDSVQDYIGSRL
ncbi:hypothetical protein [Thalassobacillus devorans]|nr:hypothetical protein [Thalassobacillus devorans]